MKSIMQQAKNNVTVIGKLLTSEWREGLTKADGRPYCSGKMTYRVEQTYGGKTEMSEIPVSAFSMKNKSDGSPNRMYTELMNFGRTYANAQSVGFESADRVKVTGGRIGENMFVSKNSGAVIKGWQLDGSFYGRANANDVDCATFDVDIFILNVAEETNSDGDNTGRLKIRGGIVTYGGNIDVVDFFVEDRDSVDYISRHWDINDTVNVRGRIRLTTEMRETSREIGFGEAIPESTPQTKRELIITTGSPEPFSEDASYDPEEIRVALAKRKAKEESLQTNAKRATTKTATQTAKTATKYDWE